MYVIRWNAKINRGRMPDAIQFIKNSTPSPTRLYANVFGDNDLLAFEAEFEGIEAAAKFIEWVDGDAQKEIKARGWYEMSAGNIVELWKVVD
jgi:hypothetical protein